MHRRCGSATAVASLCCAASLVAACASGPRSARREQVEELHRIAIVSRVEPSAPRVALAAENPARSASAAERLSKTVGRFEVEERLRVAVVARLPSRAPWSTAMPAVEIATLLQDLLVEDGRAAPDYRVLGRNGCDAVLEVRVADYGVRERDGRAVLFLAGRARLFTLRGAELGSVPLELELAETAAGRVDVDALAGGGYRDAMVELLDAAATRAVSGLGIAGQGEPR